MALHAPVHYEKTTDGEDVSNHANTLSGHLPLFTAFEGRLRKMH